jgi:hypothetical protein
MIAGKANRATPASTTPAPLSTGLVVLGVVLTILKALGLITLSWWLCTLPLWFGLAIAGALILGGLGLLTLVFVFGLLHDFVYLPVRRAWRRR